MKNEIRNKIIGVSIILILFLVVFLYQGKLNLECELGRTYKYKVQDITLRLKTTIDYLETDDLNKEIIQRQLDDLVLVSNITNDSRSISLDFFNILLNHNNSEKIFSNKDYREDVLVLLKKCYTTLDNALIDVEAYKEKHIMYKIKNAFTEKYQDKILYDYFTQKSGDKRYITKFNEVFYTKLEK